TASRRSRRWTSAPSRPSSKPPTSPSGATSSCSSCSSSAWSPAGPTGPRRCNDMSGGADDLSGRWHGFYSYVGGAHACAFEAELKDHGGEIVGVTFEVAQFGRDPGATLSASVEGRRIGRAVDLAKIYDEVGLAGYTIR